MLSYSRRLALHAVFGVAVVEAIALLASPASAQPQYNTVALSGAIGTGMGLGPNLGAGVNFSTLNPPVLNASGKVAFTGSLTGSGTGPTDTRGIWSNAGGSLAVVARSGTGVPGPNVGEGVTFGSFTAAVLSDAGDVAFWSQLSGNVDGTNSTGIFINSGGVVGAVARAGSSGPGPNVGTGVNFDAFNSDPDFNAAGSVAFFGTLAGTGVTSSNNRGVWSTVGGTLAVVAGAGSGGPGPGVGAGVDFIGINLPVLNAGGTVAFRGSLTGTGVTPSNAGGIWTNAGGSLTIVAREGSVGPGPGVGAGVSFFNIGNPVIDASGKVAFLSSLSGTGVSSLNNQGIWSNTGGSLAVVARKGAGGPGPNVGTGVHFSDFSSTGPVLNSGGIIAFRATITGTGVDSSNDTGIWTNSGGTLLIIAREGGNGPGPGLGTDVNFDILNNPVMNGVGDLAFYATLVGTGVDSSNNTGIWRSTADGPLELVIRKGQIIDVDPAVGVDMRTINGINFLDTSFARGRTFNDAGMLTFKLSFTDGSSGVFTTVVPEPACLSLFAVAGVALFRRRRC